MSIGTTIFEIFITVFRLLFVSIIPKLCSLDRVKGSISSLSPNRKVKKTIPCSGEATGLRKICGHHLWLLIEIYELKWPKEGEVLVGKDNRWEAEVYQDSNNYEERFSLSLFVADSKGNKRIREWLEAGNTIGNYTGLKGIPGVHRLARIDGLRLKKV